jgi:transposase
VKAARAGWFEQFAGVRVGQLVFLDEFGATTTMQRTHGRAPPGDRVVSKVPHGHWKVLSTIAAMTVADTFVAFVREGLVPTLVPGQVVVLDNLSAHKAAAVRPLVESTGARLLPLPPYSPDLNPIELAISKIKTVLRKLAWPFGGRRHDRNRRGVGVDHAGRRVALHRVSRVLATMRCKPL